MEIVKGASLEFDSPIIGQKSFLAIHSSTLKSYPKLAVFAVRFSENNSANEPWIYTFVAHRAFVGGPLIIDAALTTIHTSCAH